MAASRPIWTGTISFGLVNIPIRLFTAVREERVAFHMLHDQDNVRLRRKLVCPADNKEIHPEHIVKGFEVHKDQYVIVAPEDLEACAPKASRTVEITDFVNLNEIDPIYYDRAYYVMPQATAIKPYRLLVEAMTRTKKVGISKFVMHDKEYLAALRPMDGMICLHTMHFGKEVVPAESVGHVAADSKVGDRELKVAQQLIGSLATRFKPERYHDDYKDCVLKMIDRKAQGEEVVAPPVVDKKPAHARDLMAALEASLAEARGNAQGNGNGAGSRNGNGHSNGNGNGRSHGSSKHPRRRKSA